MNTSSDLPEAGWIRTMRDEAGISSYELARRAGVSQPTVMNWERRERSGAITLASLRRAAKALDGDFVYEITRRSAKPKSRKPTFTPTIKTATKPSRHREPAPVTTLPVRSMDPNSIWE